MTQIRYAIKTIVVKYTFLLIHGIVIGVHLCGCVLLFDYVTGRPVTSSLSDIIGTAVITWLFAAAWFN